MNQSKTERGYFRRLCAAWRGRKPPPVVQPEAALSPEAQNLTAEIARLKARVAGLELDLAERDQRVAAMQAEYAALRAEKVQAEQGAGEDVLAQAFKPLTTPLSSLAALTAWAEQGKTVETADLIQLARDLEKQLARSGLERLGTVGEAVGFDPALHQRMSGGSVSAGTPVTVQLPGYRLGARVLLKVMVSASGEG